MRKYFRLWWFYTVRTMQIAFVSRLGVAIFTLGKLLRFGLYFFFITILLSQTKDLAGYTFWEVILVFATFNFIDTTAQFFLREVYRFRPQVISGAFDYTLLKPGSPLFRILFGGSDILDLPMIVISLLLIGISLSHVAFTVAGFIIYVMLVLNALAIAFAFHIFVIGLGIVTTEVDHTLWMYRDLTQMGRIPVDVYREPLRAFITFIVPVGIMMTFPVKALLGALSVTGLFTGFVVAGLFLGTSLWFWEYALKRYASASS